MAQVSMPLSKELETCQHLQDIITGKSKKKMDDSQFLISGSLD
jgi:hypothetical protein